MFEVPNLDDFSHEPGDQAEAARVLKILAEYCQTRSAGIVARLGGNIPLAMKYERENDHRFLTLPEWARW